MELWNEKRFRNEDMKKFEEGFEQTIVILEVEHDS